MRTVREIMQRDVVTLAPEATIRDFARVLEDHGVSGVPVCDHMRNVLGVASASDLVRFAAESDEESFSDESDEEGQWVGETEETENESAAWSYFLNEEPPSRFVDLVAHHGLDLDETTVREIMTPVPYTVSPDASMAELATLLLDHRIHRALVVADDRLVGIVTTLDVLRTIAEGNGAAG
jgi:CBS domain-containing protein